MKIWLILLQAMPRLWKDIYEKMGATVLPDWRICRVSGDKISQLAHQQEESS